MEPFGRIPYLGACAQVRKRQTMERGDKDADDGKPVRSSRERRAEKSQACGFLRRNSRQVRKNAMASGTQLPIHASGLARQTPI